MQITTTAKSFDLCNEALFNHVNEAPFDTLVKHFPLRWRG